MKLATVFMNIQAIMDIGHYDSIKIPLVIFFGTTTALEGIF